MPDSPDDFPALMERVLAGSPDAARALIDHYGPALLRAIRRNLHRRLRTQFDSLDFAQDVWASFFAELPRGRAFRGPDELAAFLATLARNKVVDTVRRRLCGQRHNLNREAPLGLALANGEAAPKAQQPSPSEVAMGHEEWERLLGSQPLVYRRVLVLLRAGKTPAAAAEEVGISVRTVRRVVSKVAPWLIG
jgi:RNA polymerase sigma-70 factor (ECF subfamily)